MFWDIPDVNSWFLFEKLLPQVTLWFLEPAGRSEQIFSGASCVATWWDESYPKDPWDWYAYMGVSKNRVGVPQNGWFILKWMIWGSTIFGNIHMNTIEINQITKLLLHVCLRLFRFILVITRIYDGWIALTCMAGNAGWGIPFQLSICLGWLKCVYIYIYICWDWCVCNQDVVILIDNFPCFTTLTIKQCYTPTKLQNVAVHGGDVFFLRNLVKNGPWICDVSPERPPQRVIKKSHLPQNPLAWGFGILVICL